jgi:hypothetical protein
MDEICPPFQRILRVSLSMDLRSPAAHIYAAKGDSGDKGGRGVPGRLKVLDCRRSGELFETRRAAARPTIGKKYKLSPQQQFIMHVLKQCRSDSPSWH